ncbi:hypothetical protein RchiOBHm_Chr4g0417911 [Rosa chinensis]|uniref:Uncharacterized protein n=1 Tax=Rosa chinensis TaxID=74649 RepID=A0A2P6QX77_ROSCH|nr:hypothetical protein RchiOBHm_Chr4g0417911 [Rosa chinensis]
MQRIMRVLKLINGTCYIKLMKQNVQSKTAVIEHKQHGGVEKLGQCCLEDIRDYKHGGKNN